MADNIARLPADEPRHHLHITIEDGVVTRRAIEHKLGSAVIELNGVPMRAENVSLTVELERRTRTWTGEAGQVVKVEAVESRIEPTTALLPVGDMVQPVNLFHPLNRGLVGRWRCLPGSREQLEVIIRRAH